MMKEDVRSMQEDVLRALCYLHKECSQSNMTELSDIIGESIEKAEAFVGNRMSFSDETSDLLEQFRFLQSFSKLNAWNRRRVVSALSEASDIRRAE